MFTRFTITILPVLALALLGACSSSSGDAAAKTESKPANSALEKAWSKARAGENPANACAVVKGSLLTDESEAARKATDQCNYDIPVKYFNVLLDQVDAGSLTCSQFMVRMSTQLRSMTMSMGGLKQAARKSANGEDSTESATGTITSAVTSDNTQSAREKVKAALSERATTVCPDLEMLFQQ